MLFSRSVVSDSLWPHGLQRTRLPRPSLSPGALLRLTFIEAVMPPNHLIPFCPLPLLPSIFPSIKVFSNEEALHIRCPNYWTTFSISPSNENSELISFRIDWFDVLAVQGTLKSLLQPHSLKCGNMYNFWKVLINEEGQNTQTVKWTENLIGQFHTRTKSKAPLKTGIIGT